MNRNFITCFVFVSRTETSSACQDGSVCNRRYTHRHTYTQAHTHTKPNQDNWPIKLVFCLSSNHSQDFDLILNASPITPLIVVFSLVFFSSKKFLVLRINSTGLLNEFSPKSLTIRIESRQTDEKTIETGLVVDNRSCKRRLNGYRNACKGKRGRNEKPVKSLQLASRPVERSRLQSVDNCESCSAYKINICLASSSFGGNVGVKKMLTSARLVIE